MLKFNKLPVIVIFDKDLIKIQGRFLLNEIYDAIKESWAEYENTEDLVFDFQQEGVWFHEGEEPILPNFKKFEK